MFRRRNNSHHEQGADEQLQKVMKISAPFVVLWTYVFFFLLNKNWGWSIEVLKLFWLTFVCLSSWYIPIMILWCVECCFDPCLIWSVSWKGFGLNVSWVFKKFLRAEIISCYKLVSFGIFLQVNELRTSLGPLTGSNLQYCTDACLKRYLVARNWNVDKSKKMLEETLKWRSTFKPEEIRWVNEN